MVVKNGVEKFRYPGRIEADGSIRVQAGSKWMPVTNSDACKSLGLDPKTVARNAAPVEGLAHMGDNGYGLVILTGAENDARIAAERAARKAALESAVPGAAEAIRLSDLAYSERERYSHAFDRMMEDEDNDGCRPPRPEDRSFAERLASHLASHPRAALYLKAKHQHEGAHWADNSGAGAAGNKAMEILMAGGSIEDAQAALAVRREVID